ncbi:MAG: motility protein A [Clostridiales Family XIII bacterium]|jgi:chemotaxis protein MotA|nr:motility protein A [Clostridiales Family XIII bacterium]
MLEITTILGYIAVIGVMIFGISYGDGSFEFSLLRNFFNVSSIFITIGGTIFALLASFPFEDFKRIPGHFKMVLRKNGKYPMEYIETITELSREARKKGLLALEDRVSEFEDEFLKESVLLIVDAIEPDKLKAWLEQKLDYIRIRNAAERHIYDRGAAFAPAFGMIGTLIGLVNMLKSMNLDDGPEVLGLNMSVALITTFYGALMANAFFIPMSNKLEIAQEKEMTIKEMIVEGVVSIKEGENPKYIQEKLMNFIEMKELQPKDEEEGESEARQRRIGFGRPKASGE